VAQGAITFRRHSEAGVPVPQAEHTAEMIGSLQSRIDEKIEETAQAICEGRDARRCFRDLLKLSDLMAALQGIEAPPASIDRAGRSGHAPADPPADIRARSGATGEHCPMTLRNPSPSRILILAKREIT
jgi:hypothetical protein